SSRVPPSSPGPRVPDPPTPFSSTAPASTDISPLSLHDALPISPRRPQRPREHQRGADGEHEVARRDQRLDVGHLVLAVGSTLMRSEEHTSELQSRVDLVCRLLLEKKKEKMIMSYTRETGDYLVL